MADLIYRPFALGEEPLVYKDALGLTQAEWDSADEKTILALQQERYAGWTAIISAIEETTSQDLERTKTEALNQWFADAKIDKIAVIKDLSKISSLPTAKIAEVASGPDAIPAEIEVLNA